MADLATVATEVHELVITLLGEDGQPRPDLNGQLLVGDRAKSFFACSELSGLRVSWGNKASRPRRLRLYFTGVAESDTWNSWLRAPQLPPPGVFRVDGRADSAREQRFQVTLGKAAAALPVRDGTLIELELTRDSAGKLADGIDEDVADSVIVRFPPGPHLLQRVELATAPYEGEPLVYGYAPALPEYPAPQLHLPAAGDPLATQLYALAGDAVEPTLHEVWRLALPFRGGALLGAVEGPIATQLWDGGLVWPEPSGSYSRMWLRIGLPAAAGALTKANQRLRNGYLPVAESTLQAGPGRDFTTLSQTAFVDRQGALRLRVVVRTEGEQPPPALLFQAIRAGLTKSLNQPRAQACIYEPLETTLTADTLRFGSSVATANQRLLPDGGVQLDVCLSLSAGTAAEPSTALSFDEALSEVQTEAEQFIAAGAQLDLPDPHLQNAWRALLLHNRLFQRGGILRYGLFPGVYDGGLFGVEEGWNIVAMAQYGHPEAAQALLERTFFDADFLKKEGQHHQYRSGLCITYARDVHSLTGDDAALRTLWPRIAANAEWIAAAFRSTQVLLPSGERPVQYGLLPKHTYGGDLTEPAYSLYGSSACWRGLRDAALLARIVGDPRAEGWAQAAQTTRQNLHTAAARIYKHDAVPPFLPFRTDEAAATPSAGDYHQLFASLILETALFGWQGQQARGLTDYLLASGRQTLGVARFDQWFGRLGIDAEYSRGTQLCALHRRDFGRFYLGLLGQVGLSCDPFTFVSPETAIVRFTPQEYQERLRAVAEQPARCDSDPCSAGTAVMLQYLRYLLVMEERDEDDLPTGTLWIGASAPPSWFLPGRAFAGRDLPTSLGKVSLRCTTSEEAVTYRIETTRPLPVEVFYFDSAGRQLSRVAVVTGAQTLTMHR